VAHKLGLSCLLQQREQSPSWILEFHTFHLSYTFSGTLHMWKSGIACTFVTPHYPSHWCYSSYISSITKSLSQHHWHYKLHYTSDTTLLSPQCYSHSISDTTVPTKLFILYTSHHSLTHHDSVPIIYQIPQYPHHNATSIIYRISQEHNLNTTQIIHQHHDLFTHWFHWHTAECDDSFLFSGASFRSSLLRTFSCHHYPPTILPSFLTSFFPSISWYNSQSCCSQIHI